VARKEWNTGRGRRKEERAAEADQGEKRNMDAGHRNRLKK
jgi:hypothetical protein